MRLVGLEPTKSLRSERSAFANLTTAAKSKLGASERNRTFMGLLPQRPQRCAAANYATDAIPLSAHSGIGSLQLAFSQERPCNIPSLANFGSGQSRAHIQIWCAEWASNPQAAVSRTARYARFPSSAHLVGEVLMTMAWLSADPRVKIGTVVTLKDDAGTWRL